MDTSRVDGVKAPQDAETDHHLVDLLALDDELRRENLEFLR